MRLIKNDTIWNDPFADLDFYLTRAFGGPDGWLRGQAGGFQGFRMDSYHDDNNYYLVAELPGFSKEDVKLQLENSVLTIEAERKRGEGENAKTYAFSRSVTVGDDVDPARVSAKLENGLLSVTLPKAEQRKPKAIAVE